MWLGNVLKKLTPEVRAWLYTIVTALLPLLAAWGIVSETEIPLYVAIAGAFLATGTAVANRPTVKPTVEEAPTVTLRSEINTRSINNV